MRWTKTPEERLLARRETDANGCWNYTGYIAPNGYGYLYWREAQGPITAPRLAAHLWKEQPPEGAFICHTCDNRRCFNPDHLYWGTAMTNARDCTERGRHALPPQTKLTWRDVYKIRALRRAGSTGRALASTFGVSEATVSEIINHRIWKERK